MFKRRHIYYNLKAYINSLFFMLLTIISILSLSADMQVSANNTPNLEIQIHTHSFISDDNMNDYTDFTVAPTGDIVFTNSGSNDPLLGANLTLWDTNGNKSHYLEYDSDFENETVHFPQKIISTLQNHFFVHDSFEHTIKEFNQNFEFKSEYRIIRESATENIPIQSLSSMTADIQNNIYIVDYVNNMIAIKRYDDTEFEMIYSSPLITSATRVAIASDMQNLFISNLDSSTNLFKYDISADVKTELSLDPDIDNIDNIFLDSANNIFFLDNNSSSLTLYKLSKISFNYEVSIYTPSTHTVDVNAFDFDIENAEFLFINDSDTELSLLNIDIDEVFFEDHTMFEHSIDFDSLEKINSPIDIVQTAYENTPVMDTPYNRTPKFILNVSDMLIVIQPETPESPHYSYILSASDTNNRTGYVLSSYLEVIERGPETENVRILNNNTPAYKYPTSLNNYDESNLVVDSLDKNFVFDAYHLTQLKDSSDYSFYEIKINENTYVYVKSIDAIVDSSQPIQPSLFTNAEIRLRDVSNVVTVFNTSTLEGTPVDILDHGKRIYLDEYEIEDGISRIKFLNDNGNVTTGYIETRYIFVPSDYSNIVNAVILLSVTILLGILLYLIKKNKTKAD